MLLSSLRQQPHRTFRCGINCELNCAQAALSPVHLFNKLDPTVGVTINNVVFSIVRIDALSFVFPHHPSDERLVDSAS
jgi:hypothetical protein